MKRTCRGATSRSGVKKQCNNYSIRQYFISSRCVTRILVLLLVYSYFYALPPYSANQNEINFHGSSTGASQSDDEVQEGCVEGESDSSSMNSDSTSDSEVCEASALHCNISASHCKLPDDASGEAMHPAISSGDFGRVVQLKAERKLTDHERLSLLDRHFIPPRNYSFPTRYVGGRSRCFSTVG